MGIGARITVIFALGALLLSFSMGSLSYFTTRHFLLAEREAAALNQAFANALVMQQYIASGNTQYAAKLASLDVGSDSDSLLVHNGTPYSSSLSLDEASSPPNCGPRSRRGTSPPRPTMPEPRANPRSS